MTKQTEPGGSSTAGPMAFGPFEFDAERTELSRNGHPVHLAPLPGRVLTLLLARAGVAVRRSTLIEALWQDPPTEVDRSLNFAIRQVRAALGDDSQRPRFIETLPRHGYRFIAPVRYIEPPRQPRDGAATHAPGGRAAAPPGRWSRRGGFALLGAALLVLAVLIPLGSRLAPETEGAPRIAVLPFSVVGASDPVRYAADGIRHELIAQLTRMPTDELLVLSLPAGVDPESEATLPPDLDYIVTGTVSGHAAESSAALQLVRISDRRVLWAARYAARAVGGIQVEADVAAQVATALSARLEISTGPSATPQPSPRARELYLTGVYLLREGAWGQLGEAIDALWASVAEAPDYPPALAALGSALLIAGDSTGRAILDRSVALDPAVAGAYESIAEDDLYRRWDFDAAARNFARAVAAHPGRPAPLYKRAFLSSLEGRHDAALADLERALVLDPVSPFLTGDLGRLLYRAGRFEEAEEYCGRALELVPTHGAARSCLLNLNLLQDRPARALPYVPDMMRAQGASEAEVAAVLDGPASAAQVTGAVGGAPAAMERYWWWVVDRLSARVERSADDLIPLAQAHVWLGDHDRALDALEEAFRRGSSALPLVAGDPCFAPLFHLERYQAVFRRAGIPLTRPPNTA